MPLPRPRGRKAARATGAHSAESSVPDDAGHLPGHLPGDQGADHGQHLHERSPSMRARVLTTLASVVFLAGWAWLANLGLNLSTWTSQPDQLLQGPFRTHAMWLSVLVVWTFMLLCLALLGRFWITLGITGLITLLLGAVNLTKLRLRNDPLFPSDTAFLSQPGFLQEMVGGRIVIAAAFGAVLVLVVAWLIGRVVGRRIPHVDTGLGRRALWAWRGLRLVVAAVCFALLLSASHFNQPDNRWRAAYDSTGLVWKFFDQRVNYLRNGFIGGLLYNMPVTAMNRPKDYSQETMQRLARKYADLAAETNRTRTGSLADTNIVLVLSESFTDPTWLQTVTWPESPIPRTQARMAETLSGRMLTAAFGGGTANVEFELLTGQSMSQFTPQVQTPYEQVVPHEDDYPNSVRMLAEQGHETIALHPFSFRMYRRPQVFENFGFTTLIDKDSMTTTDRVSGGRFISDKATFEEVQHQIDTHDEPILMHVISMQNHMPYGKQYDDPIPPSDGLSPANTRLAGQYARGLQLTDDALNDWLEDLQQQEERTAVVFYGDHLPAQVYPAGFEGREGRRTAHETPYLIWDNKTPFPHRERPTTSPNQFLPMLFEAAKAPIPPMYALLDTLRAQLPAIDSGLMIGPDDEPVRRADFTPAQRQALHDFRLFQYDLSIGQRYTAETMFELPGD